MDSEDPNKDTSNGGILNPDEYILNKINDFSSTDQSTKNNSEQPSIREKDKIENNQNLDSNLSKIEENNNSKTNEDNKTKKLTKTDQELIKELKNENYKKLFNKYQYCDFRDGINSDWDVGIIIEINEDSCIVEDMLERKKKYKISIDNSENLSYFRRYSKPTDNNYINKRENKEGLKKRLIFLENILKEKDNENYILKIDNKLSTWEIYYLLHSKIYFGLDNAMKVNESYNYIYGHNKSENEGAEESLRIILYILFFISQYFKYLLDNKEEFINYQNNKEKEEFIDLKIVNKKYAFFSFFEESLNLIDKIFANCKDYLYWFQVFEDELKELIPPNDNQNNPNPEFFGVYEEEEENGNDEKEEGKENNNKEITSGNNKNKLVLKKICLKNAYKKGTTFTSNKIKIKAYFLAYLVDFFNAYNGLSYFYQLACCSYEENIKYLLMIYNAFSSVKIITDIYSNLQEEKKILLEFNYKYFENLNEKTIKEYKSEEIINFINSSTIYVVKNRIDEQKIKEKLYFTYTAKTLLLSKKLEEKISALNEINDILKLIQNYTDVYNKNIKIKVMNFEEFCINCKKNKILPTLLSDKNVHEEIIKKLPEIIFVMYKYNFGYTNKEEDKEKINTEKKMIFNVLFDKLLESQQNNEKLVKNLQNIICDFCEILSEKDKLYLYEEIEKYLDKNITKKGIPLKEHLLFVKDYSLRAIRTRKARKENDEEKESETKNEEENIKTVKEENANSIKGKIIDLNKDKYYGFGLLLNYLSQEQYQKYNMTNEQKIELINTSILGIIQLIENSKEKDLILKYILSKAILSINHSKDAVQFLILFEKIYKNKSLNSILNQILEENSKNNELLLVLMKDMNRYLSFINNNIKENEKEDISKECKKVYEGLFDNEKNIKLRLELIFALLENELNEENLKHFNQEIINSCEKNIYANDCLNKYINDNLQKFDLKFIQFFYDNILLSKGKCDYNDLQYYKLCDEMIKKINKINKKFYFMNNKDLAVINCESENDIKGIDLLWNFLIKTKNNKIRNNVTEFLADIFFGIRLENQEKMEKLWKNFISSIYEKLDEIVKLENENKEKDQNEHGIQGIISLIKKIENKFSSKGDIINNVSRIMEEINLNKVEQIGKLEKKQGNENEKENQEMKKENDKKEEKFKRVSFTGKVYGTDKILNYDLRIDSTEYFYMFRYKLSSFFKIPVNLIKVTVEESLYEKQIQEQLKFVEFNLYNDFNNFYTILNNLEQIINKGSNKIDNENPLILKIEIIKDNEKLKYIKKIIKDFPKLLKLLKRNKSDYLLDVWCLIKGDDNIKIDSNIIDIIKEILNNDDSEKLNSTFDFENTNIYYTSYILFHLNNVINELNKTNDKFIIEIFLKSKIWKEKLKNINLENSANPHLGEIYEKNNIINYLLGIFKIISQKIEDKNILLFILNKIFEYYYQTIRECISINLRKLPSTEGIRIDIIEDLYIANTTIIKEIIIQNKIIYDNFINILLNSETPENNEIKSQFEFLFTQGLLKNKIFSLNQKLQSFLLTIADDKFFKEVNQEKNKIVINDFYCFLINFFININRNREIINCIKDLSLDKSMDIYLYIEKFENNIKLYFELIINILDKVYPVIYNKFNFKSFINEILLKQIYNPIIEGISLELSFHQIVFGGNCKILLYLLNKVNNKLDELGIDINEEKKLKKYLFEEIILSKCNQNIFTKENIDNYRSISISSSYSFKEAINLYIFLIMHNIENESEKEINYILDKLTELHKKSYWKGDGSLDWKLESKDNNKLSPFIGLKNLGCTCYMNSLLQVFFNIIPFRESLLKCKCKEEEKNALYQIKKVFYSLKYLQVDYYTPSDFPNNFDDEVLNVHLQMDVDEFFGQILDKIENRLKNTKNENLVKYFFQGRQNDNLTFQEGCNHHRTNIINFYSIQLQIKNKQNIYESLDALTEGELMNGDNCIFCPECNKKFPAVKSQNFKTLPRILIFVLKRFDFDYDTMRKVKINDYYEFPLELDMSKYMSENKNDPELNKYVLKSVVVHMGNCEGGHYYAFIKNKNDQWYEFNDTQVTPFDINFLKEEGFGGEEEYLNNGNKEVNKKNRSAYLLFYEKLNQSDCEQFDNIEAINSFLKIMKTPVDGKIEVDHQQNIININKLENEVIEEKKEDENGMKSILENLNKEMFKYYLNKKLFSTEYQYFILELYLNIFNFYYSYDLPIFLKHLCRTPNNGQILREIQAYGSNLNSYIDKKKLILFSKNIDSKQKTKPKPEIILNVFKHFILYFYNVFLRTKEKEFLGGMVDLIKFLINDQPDCANFLIEEFCNINVIFEYLIGCPVYEIKKIIVGILYCAMIKSIGEYESNIKMIENNKKKSIFSKFINNNKIQLIKEDEEMARQLSNNLNGGKNYEYNNPFEYEGIPKNILKMIYNILYIIRQYKYSNMNEYRFLYFTIYRFSSLSENTRLFLINKCRVFELLCLLLHKNQATYNYDTKGIIDSTFKGPFTVSHDILNSKGKKVEDELPPDKVGMYRIENYIYMLFFYLLSYTPKNKSKILIEEDSGYLLDNQDFVAVLLNNIRTKQDAFAFSNYINEKCLNNKNKIIKVFEVLISYLGKVDNNENINYDYNNYNNFINNNMNENPNANDPGINPKYLLIIIKRFISTLNVKTDYVQKGIKLIFRVFSNYEKYYNFCMMIIDFIIELFYTCLRPYVSLFQKELDFTIQWLEKNPISPNLYPIQGLFLYKNGSKNYNENIPEEQLKDFEEKEFEKTRKIIEKISSIKIGKFDKNIKYKEEKDLMDFKFIIGDVIFYDGKETMVEEALDESIKITVDINKKNGKEKGGINNRKEIWVDTDNPKIEIKD